MRRNCGRNLLAAAESREGERNARDPAPARGEHRRVEHRLDKDRAHARRMEVARDLAKLEAVGAGERQYDIVLGRRRLQFEVELAAKALAQRQAPGPIEAAAERRVNDELHAARFVEEALEHDRVLSRQAAERRGGGGQILDELLGRRLANADFLGEPTLRGRSRRIGFEARRDLGAQTRDGQRKAHPSGPAPRRARRELSAAAPSRPRPGPSRARPAECDRTCCRAGRCRRPCSRPRNPRSPCR